MAPRSDEAIQSEIKSTDKLFAAVGLKHGSRLGRANTPVPRAGDSTDLSATWDSSPRGVEVLRVEDWARFDWLLHGFSTRTGGMSSVYGSGQDRADLNLGFTAHDDAQKVAENRRIFVNAVAPKLDVASESVERGPNRTSGSRDAAPASDSGGVPPTPRSMGTAPQLIVLKQIHSSLIHRVERVEKDRPGSTGVTPPAPISGDGLMTDEPGVLLGILTADCIPILLVDRKKRAVAALHAGWRGTLKRLVESGVGRMRLEFGSSPEDLAAAIGPGIGSCCYAVGEEVRDEFESQFAYAPELFREVSDSDPVKQKYPMLFMTARAPGHSNLGPSLHLDLAEANRRQLLDAGLKPARITMLNQCTSCHPERFFSHRQQNGFTGRMMAVIGVRA